MATKNHWRDVALANRVELNSLALRLHRAEHRLNGRAATIRRLLENIDEHAEHIRMLRDEIGRLRRERLHLWHIADWFASNPPGTPVPEWCELALSCGEPDVSEEEMAAREANQGRKERD